MMWWAWSEGVGTVRKKNDSIALPALLLAASGAVTGWAVLLGGPGRSPLALLGAVCCLACLVLLAIALIRHKPPAKHSILVDGSNVLHWKNDLPDLSAVGTVLAELKARGFTPGVMFDANVGYKIGSRYLDDRHLAKILGLPEDQVFVVPKGTPADGYLLMAARQLGAQVVTNDRFRDWAEAHPEVCKPGLLVRGGFTDGHLWLDAPVAQPMVARS